jgi:Domain of unknown function (DUF4604)
MSQKITSKNLSYDSTVPPFLAALQAQVSGSAAPESLLAARRRPAKHRSRSEEAEDEPLIVDEKGNEISLQDQAGSGDKKDSATGIEPAKAEDPSKPSKAQETEKLTGIGISKKRKVGKVVGDEAEARSKPPADEQFNDRGVAAEDKGKTSKNTIRKKPKKIKLSFDEDGE